MVFRNNKYVMSKEKQSEAIQKMKAQNEQPEPVKDIYGNTSIIQINTKTHSKIVLSNQVLLKLKRCGHSSTSTYYESFNDIVDRIVSYYMKKHRYVDDED